MLTGLSGVDPAGWIRQLTAALALPHTAVEKTTKPKDLLTPATNKR